MYQLLLKPRAILMAKDAYSWYEIQLEGLGESFLDELDAGYKKIVTNPSYYSFLENGFRRILLNKFPYIIIYEILGKTIVVYAIFHTSRNPDERLID